MGVLSPLAELSVVLLALYLLDCAYRVPDTAVIFERTMFGKWRWSHAGLRPERGRTKMHWSWPMPPVGALFECRLVESRLDTRRESLEGRGEEERLAETERWLAASANRSVIHQRLVTFKEGARPLAWMCGLLHAFLGFAVFAFLLVPLLSIQVLVLLLALMVLGVATAWTWRAAHIQLFPTKGRERRRIFMNLALAPMNAARSYQTLSRHALEDYDPLAVASVLLPAEGFRRCARSILGPMVARTMTKRLDHVHGDSIASFLDLYLRVAQEPLAARQTSFSEVLRPLKADRVDGLSYCMSCEAIYRVLDGNCDDCGGVQLLPLAAEGEDLIERIRHTRTATPL